MDFTPKGTIEKDLFCFSVLKSRYFHNKPNHPRFPNVMKLFYCLTPNEWFPAQMEVYFEKKCMGWKLVCFAEIKKTARK